MKRPPAKKHGEAHLVPEDRILWEKLARSVTPLGPARPMGLDLAEVEDFAEAFEAGMVPVPLPHSVASPPAIVPPKAPEPPAVKAVGRKPAAQLLDGLTTRKIARGKLVIEARIDLHGMTQDEAHGLLLSFLARAAQRHLRTVLVITGKGRSARSEGVLKRAVPQWLGQPAFARLVSGYGDAAPGHGGAGALYVRLRRSGHETA